jgi:hypothetical protein
MNGYRWIPRLPIDGVRIDMIHRERFALTQRLESEKPAGFSTNNAAWLMPGVRKWIGQQGSIPDADHLHIWSQLADPASPMAQRLVAHLGSKT